MSLNNSVLKAIRILELISKYPDGITLSNIYKELNLPKATTFDILKALYDEDCVYYKNPELKNYVIGSKVFSIGEAYNKNSNLIHYSKGFLKEFSDKYNETSFCCKRIGNKVCYVYKYTGKDARLITPEVGSQNNLNNNAEGKVVLAFEQIDKRNNIIDELYKSKSLKEKETFINELNNIKEKGYYLDLGENTPYIMSLAVPTFDFENKSAGVLFTTAFITDEIKNNINAIKNEFIQIAKIVSKKQGYLNRK